MKESVSQGNPVTPVLFPYEPEQFWKSMRQIIREEVTQAEIPKPDQPAYETPGLTYKPLYKIAEVCNLFHVTKPTIYDWIRHLLNKHRYPVAPEFYVINFDDLSRSHRCNPLDVSTMVDITDAAESSRTIMLGLNQEWIKKGGDFFVESPINFVTALI